MGALIITGKDLRLLARDMRALAILVVLPLVFITILGMTFGKVLGWQAENQVLQIAFVDQVDYDAIKDDEPGDRTLTREQKVRNAHKLVADVMNDLQGEKGMRVIVGSQAEADDALEKGQINAIVTFGPRFYQIVHGLRLRDVLDPQEGSISGRAFDALDIQIQGRKSFDGMTSVVKLALGSSLQANGASYISCENPITRRSNATRCKEWDAEYDPDEAFAAIDPPAAVEQGSDKSDAVYNRVVPGLTVMFMFFLVNIMARSFIHERDLGTLRRLRIAPIRPASVLAGKTIPFLIVSLVQSGLLFACGKLLFDMSWGADPWLLLPIVFCTSCAATALGLLVATWVKTDSQVSAYANIVVISMAGVSGCLVPRDMLPWQMQRFSLVTPHAWAVEAFHEILPENGHVPDLNLVWQSCGMLLAFALAFFAVGVVRFARTR